jgi:uncharacterized protein
MVVIQDTRGRFASEGEGLPFRFEREDGYDSVEWAARLPGSNGRVGIFGLSYFGNTQWMAAVEQTAIACRNRLRLTWSDPLDGLFGRGGAVELGITVPWTLPMGAGHLAKRSPSDQERTRRLAAFLDDYDGLPRGYEDVPVHDLPWPSSRRRLAASSSSATASSPPRRAWTGTSSSA